MTTRILTGVYTSTYSLTSPVTLLSITASGYLEVGLTASGAGTYTLINDGEVRGSSAAVSFAGAGVVTNAGTIVNASTTAGSAGVILAAGGSVANDAGALIGGYYGVVLAGSASTLTNDGMILASGRYGVKLLAGGLVTNGGTADTAALIRGQDAVIIGLPGTLRNFGTVAGVGTGGIGGVLLTGGAVVNGADADRTATVQGASAGIIVGGATGTVTNYGAVRATGTSGAAIALVEGGTVVNGSAADTTALIEGTVGVVIEALAGTVTNFGVIRGGPGSVGSKIGGVYLSGGGLVTNGSTIDTTAQIDGQVGVYAQTIAATVHNFGAIGDPATVVGVFLKAGGSLTNGAANDTTALIQGYIGAAATGPITAVNFGTIEANGGPSGLSVNPGVYAVGGGRVTNGGTSDTAAVISGQQGVFATTDAFTVTNFGSILGTEQGVRLNAGGAVVNGAAGDTGALIQGASYGLYMYGVSDAVTNFGTIRAGGASGFGVMIRGPGVVTNGSSGDTKALMQGLVGLDLRNKDTATNWAIVNGSASNYSIGAYLGYKCSLANRAGALVRGAIGAFVGSYATLTNFGTVRGVSGVSVQLDVASSRLNAEAGSVFAGVVEVLGGGTVDAVGGVSTMSGLRSPGKVVGAGTIALNGGASVFVSGTSLSVAKIAVAGAATTVEVATKLTDAKLWSQTGGTLTVDAGDQLTFTGIGDSFAGTLTGAGEIAFVGGADAIAGATLSAATMVVNGATVTLGGSITLTKTLNVTSPNIVIAAGGATLGGGGSIVLSNNSTNKIIGATSSATLTNAGDRISGAGQLGGGSMKLINKAGGVIDGNVSNQLIIGAGINTIVNAGIIENTGSGGTLIASPVSNTGQLMVTTGTLTVTGAVTGAGTLRIGGGTADLGFTFAENVTFTATTGVLELSHSQSYTGKITGFSKTGTTSLDLLDIASATAKASFSGTTTSGVLTVTDGTHTAKITLVGNYTASTFTVSSDGHGGTKVVDPTRPPAATATRTASLIDAMAAFGTGDAAALSRPLQSPRLDHPMLAAPAHTALA